MIQENRQSIRNTPYMLRNQGMFSIDKQKQKQRVQIFTILLALGLLLRHRNRQFSRVVLFLSLYYYASYYHQARIIYMQRRWRNDYAVSFNNLPEDLCHHLLRFRKNDLWRISDALALPERLVLDNNSVTNNQEMLIVLLIRMASPEKWLALSCITGIEYSRMSRIFKATINHVHALFQYKLDDNWDYWANRMIMYKRFHRRKLFQSFIYGYIPPRFQHCFASIDGKRFRISRPSGQGNQQAAAYNAYYKFHNIGFQGVTAPDGMIIDFSGPWAGSDNDLNMLANSHILERIRQTAIDHNFADINYNLIADKIYNIAVDGISSLRVNPQGEFEEAENVAASNCRVVDEWSFGKIVDNFPFIDYSKKLKVNEREIAIYMRVGALLTNIHTCLYGGQTSQHFSIGSNIILPPTLEDYMAP